MATATETKPLAEIIRKHLAGERTLNSFIEESGIQKDRYRRVVAGDLRMYADEARWFATTLGLTIEQVIDAIPNDE